MHPAVITAVSLAFASPAQDAPDIHKKVEQLEIDNKRLRERVDRLEGQKGATGSLDEELESLSAPGTQGRGSGLLGSTSRGLTLEGQALVDEGLSQAFGGIYSKPFLVDGDNVTVGGYASWLYENSEDADGNFEFPRLVPFIYAQVSERVRFATEIEIEEGHEVEVEFAFVDFDITEAFNVRGGLILDPLGKFNLVHDDPVNELTDRPLVDQTIIPSALREVGLGAFGTIADADSDIGRLSYEAYLTSGFRGLFDDGTVGFNTDSGLHDGKANEEIGGLEPFEDNNNDIAEVGRLEWSPVLGGAIAVSAHYGAYDESADNMLLILALDAALDGKVIARCVGAEGSLARVIGGFEFLGEWASADIERDAFAKSAGVPDDMCGWYAQVNYRLYPEFLQQWQKDGYVSAGSHFTLVTRRDAINLDGFDYERWTFGVNFRPNQSRTVIKFDYQLNGESGDTVQVDNDAFLMSIATYF